MMIKSVDEVLRALGGNRRVAELCGVGVPATYMWRARDRIPPEYFVLMTAKLAPRRVDPSVFGQILETRP